MGARCQKRYPIIGCRGRISCRCLLYPSMILSPSSKRPTGITHQPRDDIVRPTGQIPKIAANFWHPRRIVLPRLSTLPAVPGRPGHPENRLLLLALSGASCLPGTVGRLGRLGGMSRIKGEAYMAALYGAIRLEGLLFGRRQRELFMPRARSYPAPTVIIL